MIAHPLAEGTRGMLLCFRVFYEVSKAGRAYQIGCFRLDTTARHAHHRPLMQNLAGQGSLYSSGMWQMRTLSEC